MFEDTPESVSSGLEENQDAEKDTPSSKASSSPKNFYSSIAKALQEEGIFPELDESKTDSISTPEDFAQIVEQTIQSKLDERQKRIDDALNVDIEVSEIRRYETTLQYLDSLEESVIINEGEDGE